MSLLDTPMFMYVLCFLLGVVVEFVVFLVWAWYLGLKERVVTAETARQDMEDAIKQFEEQQKAAQETLQNTIDAMIKRRAQPSKKAVPQVQTEVNANSSVKDRLKRAVEITLLQQKIDTRQGPDFVVQHNELELEKLTVLKTILADGFDPLITIRYNTGEQEMLLSAYVQSITKGLA